MKCPPPTMEDWRKSFFLHRDAGGLKEEWRMWWDFVLLCFMFVVCFKSPTIFSTHRQRCDNSGCYWWEKRRWGGKNTFMCRRSPHFLSLWLTDSVTIALREFTLFSLSQRLSRLIVILRVFVFFVFFPGETLEINQSSSLPSSPPHKHILALRVT